MKYRILLPLTIEAAPADVAGAAKKGFQALADLFNSGEPVTIHLLPQDGSEEAVLGESVLNACFQAHSTPKF